jgi:hypothetical protein
MIEHDAALFRVTDQDDAHRFASALPVLQETEVDGSGRPEHLSAVDAIEPKSCGPLAGAHATRRVGGSRTPGLEVKGHGGSQADVTARCFTAVIGAERRLGVGG